MIEITEIIAIAEKVNKMNYGQVRLEIKKLNSEFNNDGLCFEKTITLQYLLMKAMTFKQ